MWYGITVNYLTNKHSRMNARETSASASYNAINVTSGQNIEKTKTGGNSAPIKKYIFHLTNTDANTQNKTKT